MRGSRVTKLVGEGSPSQGTFMIRTLVGRLLREDHAQNLIEYALLAAGIALAAIIAIQALGDALNTQFDNLADDVENAGS